VVGRISERVAVYYVYGVYVAVSLASYRTLTSALYTGESLQRKMSVRKRLFHIIARIWMLYFIYNINVVIKFKIQYCIKSCLQNVVVKEG
jgi:ribosome-associated toxin RatA of RatAB toxin-antitoxin module